MAPSSAPSYTPKDAYKRQCERKLFPYFHGWIENKLGFLTRKNLN